MKIFGLYSRNQRLGIKAGIINVPVNVRTMFQTIPILPDQAQVVQLKLKRRINDPGHYMYQAIRTNIVYKAAQYLVRQPLYREMEITINAPWIENPPLEFDVEQIGDALRNHAEEELDDEEENVVNNVIEQETMLDNNEGIEFAPGEGETPIYLLLDPCAEELSFPEIDCGHKRIQSEQSKLSYSEIVQSEIQRRDRRSVEAAHLLYMHKKCHLLQIRNNISTALRKTRRNDQVTVNDILNTDGFVENIVKNDEGYHFLKQITGSPIYFESQKKNVMARR